MVCFRHLHDDNSSLAAGPGSSKLGLRTTTAIIFGRLVLVPPAGIGIVLLADKLGFLPPDDKMFRFVLLLQHSMPTSVLSGNNQFPTLMPSFKFKANRTLFSLFMHLQDFLIPWTIEKRGKALVF